VSKIPQGKVTTYGEFTKALGIKDARVASWALHQNKDQAIPRHRVVNKNGFLAKNYAFDGGKIEKIRKEGIKFIGKFQINLKNHFWKPKMLK